MNGILYIKKLATFCKGSRFFIQLNIQADLS